MFGLRNIALGVTALLLGKAIAAPLPHVPAIGEVVQVAPANTHGGQVLGAGGYNPHPHITVGHDGAGNAILHPVTHSNHPGLGPTVSTNGHGGLTGNILLRPVTASYNVIQPGQGHHAGNNVGQNGLNHINNAIQTHALRQAHNDAAHRHGQAATEHTNAAAAHHLAAQQHAAAGHHNWAAAHTAQGNWHTQQAQAHTTHQANHHAAAAAVTGPNAHALAQAQASAHGAHNSRNGAANSATYAANTHGHYAAQQAHLGAAHAHTTLAQSYQNMGPQFGGHAQHHFQQAQHHQQVATSHAVGSPNAPHPHTSAQAAHQSTATANHLKNQIPPHLRVH